MSDALTQIKALIEELKREIHQRLDSLVVSARQIRTSSLSEISTILGLIQSFEFRTPGNPGMDENYSGVVIKTDGIETYFEDNQTGSIAQDGDVKFGSNVNSPTTTGFHIFSNAQTYNGESMGAGDILLGDNSSGKPNAFWDASNSELTFRLGTIITNKMGVGRSMSNVGARIQRSSDQTIDYLTQTAISFDQVIFDDSGFYSSGSPTKFTIPTNMGGTYLVGANLQWEYTASDISQFAGIVLNGTSNVASVTMDAPPAMNSNMSITGIIQLSAGDYIELWVSHNLAGGLDIDYLSGAQMPSFWLLRLR